MKACFDGLQVIETGLKHGTLTVVADKTPYEVTTYRIDGPYLDNRRPSEVVFVDDIEKDLARRDFTVNAMAFNRARGLVDPFGGLRDLNACVLRCVGDPDARFHEDGLRILRALRFASVLRMVIVPETARYLHEDRELLRNISAERISTELTKLLCGEDAARVMLEYPDVLGVFIPELLPAVGFGQNNPHHRYDVWTHTAAAVNGVPPEPVLRLVMLFHDFGKPMSYTSDSDGIGHFYGHPEKSAAIAGEIMKRLRFDNETADTVMTLVRYHDAKLKPEPRSILRWLNRVGPENFKRLLIIKLADAAAQNAEEFPETVEEIADINAMLESLLKERRCFSLKDLSVNGDDLIALGIPHGAQIGAALTALLDLVIDGKVENDREALLAAAKTMREQG